MNIISGSSVDLITPFPPSEAQRIWGWQHCYRTLPEDDDAPKDKEAFVASVSELLPVAISAGIIDKQQLTSTRHEAPMVGLVMLIPSTPRDGALHFAAGRKAFKMGLVEEALVLALPAIFDGSPSLLRISCLLDESNTPAKSLLKRLGFRFEGVQRDAVMQGGMPRSRVLFGLTRASIAPIAAEATQEVVSVDSEGEQVE
jgi:hypothetical protein